jgi:hypothetical protein
MLRDRHLLTQSVYLSFLEPQFSPGRRENPVAFTRVASSNCRRAWQRCRAQVDSLPIPTRAPSTALRIACVGDVHDQWSDEDAALLDSVVQPDVVLFTGDYGNENVRLVRAVAAYAAARRSSSHPPRFIASVFGNHDAWYTASPQRQRRQKYAVDPFGSVLDTAVAEDSVQEQLALLRDIDVGYRARTLQLSRMMEGPLLTVVGGRPFSWGGPQWRYPRFYEDYFQVHDMDESALRIRSCLLAEIERVWQSRSLGQWLAHATNGVLRAEGPCLGVHQILLLAHNGPLGLGNEPHSICGRDFRLGFSSELMPGGDFGCPDLAAVIQSLKDAPKIPLRDIQATVHVDIPLCVFGHMHERLQFDPHGCGLRQMVVEQDGTVYVNAAVVPRVRPATAMAELFEGVPLMDENQRYHCFTVIDLARERAPAILALGSISDPEGPFMYRVDRVRQVWMPSDAPRASSYETCLYQRA